MGQNYYSKFLFTASGLDKVLSEFSATSARIKAESAAIGKMNFTGMNAALPALERIEASITTISGSMRMLASAELNAGAGMDKIAVGATRAATTTKSVSTSMAQLATTAGTATVAAGRTTGALTAMGAAGKSAFSGIVTGAERAIGAIASVGAAAGRTAIQMASMGSIPFLNLRGLQGLFAGSVLGSMASTLLNPVNVASAGVGYGIYSGMNLQKSGTMAAGKSGASGAEAKAIEKIVWDSAQSFMGQYAYTPNQIGEMEVSYAAMGGNLTDLGTTKGVVKNALDFAQAVNMELAPAMELLYSQALNWSGFQTMQGPGATQAIQDMGDALTVLSNQTRLNPEDLNTALKSSTAVAKVSGMDQNQLYAAVGSLSQLGREPQQADSDVRRLIMRLTPSYNALQQQQADELGLWTDAAGKQKDLSALNEGLKEIGLTYRDISLEANNGDLVKSITKITDAMNAAGWDQLTQESFLKTQLGIQGTTPFYLLGQQSGQDIYYNLLEKLLNKAGIAATGAKTQLDELWGSLGKLKSNVVGTANSLGAHFMPATKRFVDFLNESAIPGLNKLGSALVAGDWKGAASILGDAYDFIKEKGVGAFEELSTSLTDSQNWADWGDIIKGAIGTAQDDLLVLSQAFSDFMTGGGAGNLLEGASSWVKNVLSALDSADLSAIWNNLSTGLDAAWSQSVEWLRGEIDGINWESVGTTLGEALESGATWAIENIGKLPWTSITTAATNALTNIVLTIDWGSLTSTLIGVGDRIGTAIYSGISAANLGILFQNWAIQFQNSMGMAIASVAASLAGLAAQMGVPVAGIQGFVDESIQEGGTLLDTGNKIVSVIADPSKETGPYSYIHTTSYQPLGEESSLGSKFYNFFSGNSWDVKTGEKNLGLLKQGIDYINSFFGSNQSVISGGQVLDMSTVQTRKELLQPVSAELDMSTVQVGPSNFDNYPGLSPELASIYRYATGRSIPSYDFTEKGKQKCLQDYEDFKNGYKSEVLRTPSTSDDEFWEDINLVNAEDNYHFLAGVTPGSNKNSSLLADPTKTYLLDPRNAADYGSNYNWGTISNPQNEAYVGDTLKLITSYKKLSSTDINAQKEYVFTGGLSDLGTFQDWGLQPGKTQGAGVTNSYIEKLIKDQEQFFNNYGSLISGAGVGGTIEKSYAGIERSTPVGQDAVDAAYKKTQKSSDGTITTSKTTKVSNDNNNDNDRKSQSKSLGGIEDNTKQMYTLLEGANAQGQSIVPRWYKTPEDAAIGKVNLEKLGYEVTSKLVPAPDIVDQNAKTIGKQTDATSSLTGETTGLTGEVSSLSSATSSLTGEFASFASLINSGDYAGISQLIKDKYAFDNPATKEDERLGVWTAEDWANIDAKTKDKSDIDAALSTYLSILKATQNPYIVPEIKKATEETAKNTKKIGTWSDPWVQFKTIKDAFSNSISEVTKSTQSTTSAVQSESDRAATQANVDSSLQQLLYSTICDIEGFFTPERVSPLGAFVSPTGGKLVRVADTWMTMDEYEATIGVSVVDQQMAAAALVGKVPFAGTISAADTPKILEYLETLTPEAMERAVVAWNKNQKITPEDFHIPEEYKRDVNWGITVGGEARKPQMEPILLGSLANGGENVEVPVEPVVNSEPIDTLKSTADAGLPYDVKVTSNAEAVAAQLNSLGGSTTFTVFVNTVSGGGQTTNFSKGTSTLPDGSIFTFNSFKTPAVPVFADGGYTGSYEGLANIHPEEVILNKAQQRNVVSTMRGSGNNIQVSISLDLRGSTITGDSAEVFAEKIATSVKEQLQGEMYR